MIRLLPIDGPLPGMCLKRHVSRFEESGDHAVFSLGGVQANRAISLFKSARNVSTTEELDSALSYVLDQCKLYAGLFESKGVMRLVPEYRRFARGVV